MGIVWPFVFCYDAIIRSKTKKYNLSAWDSPRLDYSTIIHSNPNCDFEVTFPPWNITFAFAPMLPSPSHEKIAV